MSSVLPYAVDGSDGSVLGAFGELLRRHRVSAGLSQRDVAGRSGLSERAVRNLELGVTTRPRHHSVRAVADALALSADDRSAFVAAGRAERAARAPVPEVALPARGELVGRDTELRVLADLVSGGRHRLVTVTGPGGVGKSRLAAELVAMLRTRTAAEVRTVDLSGLGEPDLVGELVAEAVGGRPASRLSPVERIAAELRGRRVVLVLDCFERLVPAAALVAALVRRCPGLTVLVTSQRPLHVRGERQVRLEPLPVPDAVRLFARCAAETAPGFTLTPDNAPAVDAICRAVDGLPLAVELAAARMRLLSPAELAARLDRPLRFLTGGARDLPERHRSLRATIAASLDLVTDQPRTLFGWLAPFAAGVRLTDLEHVATRLGAGCAWLVDALTELVDFGLLRVRTDGTASRYVLPDAMRELAEELLGADPERAVVERAVATRYLDRLRLAAARSDGAGYAALDPDVDNVRAALAWARRHDPAAVDTAVVEALHTYHESRGRFAEGRAALVALADAGAAGAARALLRAGQLSQYLGDLDEGQRLVARGRAALAPDDHAGTAIVALLLGTRAHKRGDAPGAIAHITGALRAAEAAGDDRMIGGALNNLAAVTGQAGDFRRAGRLMRRALAAKQRANADDLDLGRTLGNLADLALVNREWDAAAGYAKRAAATLDRGGHVRLRANALSTLALARLREGAGGDAGGDTGGAAAAMAEALRLLDSFGEDRWLRGLVRARYSVVLHAGGLRDAAATELADAVPTIRSEPMRYHVPPIIEAHAALLAGADPAAAATLRGLADAVRAGTARSDDPVADLATLARVLTQGQDDYMEVGASPRG